MVTGCNMANAENIFHFRQASLWTATVWLWLVGSTAEWYQWRTKRSEAPAHDAPPELEEFEWNIMS